MSFSASRLTCYALISAMESDMRALIEDRWPELDLNEISPQAVAAAQGRRSKEKLPAASTIGALLPHMEFADSFQIISPRIDQLPSEARKSIQSLKVAFERLVTIRNQVAHTKPMQIDDAAFTADEATKLTALRT